MGWTEQQLYLENTPEFIEILAAYLRHENG